MFFFFLHKQPRQENEKFDNEIYLWICFRQEKLLPDINQSVLLNCTWSSQKAELSLDESNLSSRRISHFWMKLLIL